MNVRSAVAGDRGLIWALNAIPNVGATADSSYPIELTPREEPPPEFPDLASVPDSFVAAGGDFLVVEEDGRLVGMGGYKRTWAEDAQVLRVRVHPARRRRGVGRRLMEAIETAAAASGARRTVLETAANQPEAIAFYRSIGYRQTHTESNPGWTWTLVWFAREIESRSRVASGAGARHHARVSPQADTPYPAPSETR